MLRTLVGPGSPVWSVAFLPDDANVADGRRRRYDPALECADRRPDRLLAERHAGDPLAAYAGDHGAEVFRACVACHTLSEKDSARAGPTLAGLFGRRIASLPGYRFSDALKKHEHRVDAGDRGKTVRGRSERLYARHQDAGAAHRVAGGPQGAHRFSGARDAPNDQAIALPALALAQIVVGRARWRALGNAGERIELLFAHGDDAAVGAHPDRVQPLVARGIHPVPALELCRDLLDRALDAERLAAADAKRRLFFLDDLGRCPGGAEIDLRLQRDDLFRAGALAQPALHAGIFDKFERRTFGIVEKRAGGTDRYAGQAQACIRPH